MRRLASFLMVAAVLPALADTPITITDAPKFISNLNAPGAKCYFIRQMNRQLQAPENKPRFIRIADLEKIPPAAPAANCMPEQSAVKIDLRK